MNPHNMPRLILAPCLSQKIPCCQATSFLPHPELVADRSPPPFYCDQPAPILHFHFLFTAFQASTTTKFRHLHCQGISILSI